MADLVGGIVSGALTRSEFGESDSDDYFENNQESFQARVVNMRVDTQEVDGSTMIWGNTTYGIWGSYYWGSAMSTPITRIKENYMWIDHEEDFTGSQYGNQAFNNLITYFNFDNDVNDSSGNNFNGSIGGATVGINTGVVGQCLSFALGGSVILPYQASSNISIAMWIKPDAVSSSSRNLVSYQRSLLRFKNNAIEWYPDVDGPAYTGSTTITTSAWHHIAVTQEGTSYTIYYNGSNIGSGTAGVVDTTNSYNYIGYYPGGTNYSGSFDEMLISTRALTADEVHFLYNSGSGNTFFVSAPGWGTGSVIFQNITQSTSIALNTGSYTSTVAATVGSIQLI